MTADLARRMRDAEATLRELNEVYGFNPEYGMWSPAMLTKEAPVVETDETL